MGDLVADQQALLHLRVGLEKSASEVRARP